MPTIQQISGSVQIVGRGSGDEREILIQWQMGEEQEYRLWCMENCVGIGSDHFRMEEGRFLDLLAGEGLHRKVCDQSQISRQTIESKMG